MRQINIKVRSKKRSGASYNSSVNRHLPSVSTGLEDPQDPAKVWQELSNQFQK